MNKQLDRFFTHHKQIFVLTGAGISTASGIPDYRDERGDWKHRRPIELQAFLACHQARQRYWARAYVGWQHFRHARPNAAHAAIAQLEQLGWLAHTVTQNVDGLHQQAGSLDLTELHGSLATVDCIDCGASIERETMQRQLLALNPRLEGLSAASAPDGDAMLVEFDASELELPICVACSGLLKPAVVFFGENIPPARVEACCVALERADAMLVVGTSLMTFSGYRFVRQARRQGLPIAAINRGVTRADAYFDLKLDRDCGPVLIEILARIAA